MEQSALVTASTPWGGGPAPGWHSLHQADRSLTGTHRLQHRSLCPPTFLLGVGKGCPSLQSQEARLARLRDGIWGRNNDEDTECFPSSRLCQASPVLIFTKSSQ